MGLKFRRGTTAQQSGSLAFGEPYVNTTLGTLVVGGATGDIVLSAGGTGSTGNFGAISGSGLDITGNANIAGNVTVGGRLQIGDNTSDTLNVVSSLSSSLIPQTTNAFDLGSASKIWRDLYISTGSIKFVDGTTVVKELSLATISGLESATGSSNVSITNLNTTTASLNTSVTNLNITTASLNTSVTNLNTTTASLNTSVSNINSFTSSQLTQNSALATISGSLISTASLNVGRLSAIEAVSGTFARTNSTNIFNGNQTVSGSLFVSQDLVVGGSSSIQNISSSNLVIGAAYVQLNTSTPSSRFAGIHIVDSGSVGGSGSFLYDAVEDEFIMIHRGNGTNVTSSHFIQGPQTYDNLGNETYLTTNRLPKASGLEHIVDSNITDTGTLITLGSNAVANGTFYATGTTLVSGSSQITAGSTTGFATGVKTQLDANTVVSGSSQINATATTNWSTGIKTRLDAETVVSGSKTISGITLGSNLGTLTISTGLSGTSYNGSTGVTIANTGVLSITTNTGLSTNSSAAGNVTITNTGVTSLTAGTGVSVSGATGGVTVSIGQAVATSSSPTFAGLTINGAITATGDITAYYSSDRRFKSNIQLIPNALEKVIKLNGVTWTWNEDVNEVTKTTPNTGLIAQEVQEVLPEVVMEREDGHLGLDYSKMMGLLVEAIKEQQTQIHSLTLEIEKLKELKGL